MARTRQLGDLIADVRHRANMENATDFVSDAEIAEWINQEWAEVHARLTTNEGQPHFRSSSPAITISSGVALYNLPPDFLKMQRMVAQIDGRYVDLEPFMEGERVALLNASSCSLSGGSAPMYRIQAGMFEILPATRNFTVTLFYTQRAPRMVGMGDTIDGFDGYEMAAVNGATAIALEKENPGSGAFYQTLKDRILTHIDAQAHQRDASHPERVTDVTGALDYFRPIG